MSWRMLLSRSLHVMRTRPVLWGFAFLASLLGLLGARTWAPSFSSSTPSSDSVGLFLLVQFLYNYLALLLLAPVVYQVMEEMPWQRSVREALGRSFSLLLLLILFGLWYPLSMVYLKILELVPPDTLLSAILGPLYLLIFVGMIVAAIFFPWMVQACIQERLPALQAVRRGWQVATRQFRTVAIFLTINAVVNLLGWGIVYAIFTLVSGSPAVEGGWMQLFQPFRWATSDSPIQLLVFLVVSTALGLFSWVFQTLTWSAMARKDAEETMTLQPAGRET